MFGKKAKMIRELEYSQACKRQEIDRLNEHIKGLEKQLRGEHVISEYCRHCEHGVSSDIWEITCALECKCRDFKVKGN